MFFVIIYSAIDQGYIGLSLASCHKDEIWDLRAELGLIWDHFRALVPIGTKSQSWVIITSTVLVIWIFSFPRPNFPKPRPRLFSETNFFRNWNRDFFSETKFSKTETLKDLAKVSKPRSFETKMSISGYSITEVKVKAKVRFFSYFFTLNPRRSNWAQTEPASLVAEASKVWDDLHSCTECDYKLTNTKMWI